MYINKLLPAEGERVTSDDIVPGPSVQGEMQVFSDCFILADGADQDVLSCGNHAHYLIWSALSCRDYGCVDIALFAFPDISALPTSLATVRRLVTLISLCPTSYIV